MRTTGHVKLQNFIERAVLLSPGLVLCLPLDLKQRVPHTVEQSSESAALTLAGADREHILEALKQTYWLIGGQDRVEWKHANPRGRALFGSWQMNATMPARPVERDLRVAGRRPRGPAHV
jgi:hypothetical protein